MCRVSRKPLCESVKVKTELPCIPQSVGDSRFLGYQPKKAANRNGTNPSEKRILQSKLKRVRDLKRVLVSDVEMQNLEFAQLIFSLVLVLTMFPFLCFGMVTYILFHYILKVCDLFFFLLF